MTESYTVRVTKDYLTFCSAHFIVFHGSQCERLHGHNFRVAAELEADLAEDYLVFDFITLKRLLRDVTDDLDHRLLVPCRSEKFKIEHDEVRVRISYDGKEWILPREDCAMLPIENATTELLASYIADRLLDKLTELGASNLKSICIEVEESAGQCARYLRTLGDAEA